MREQDAVQGGEKQTSMKNDLKICFSWIIVFFFLKKKGTLHLTSDHKSGHGQKQAKKEHKSIQHNKYPKALTESSCFQGYSSVSFLLVGLVKKKVFSLWFHV